jgi:hypothetical protein
MREWNKPASTLLFGLSLWTICFYVYLSHLSFNYTFDGLAMSSQAEKDNLPLWLYFHPHHLLYTFLGRLFFLWGRAHGATWDGLVALQFFDILTGTLGALIAYHLLLRETNDRLIAVLSAAGMIFCHSYWYFSTIPGVRIFATVTPLLAWYALTYVKKLPPAFGWVLGFAHVLAVLGHQTNLLLIPAFLGGILLLKEKTLWERIRASIYYLTALTIGVLSAYGIIGRYIYYRKTFHEWLWWVFSYFHSPQKWGGHFKPSGFERGGSAMVRAFLPNVPPLKNMTESLTFSAAETILQYAVLVLLAVLLLRFRHYWNRHRQALWVSILWIVAFVPFFVWWEPWNIEFWVSSTVPCWILLGLVVSDLSKYWKNPVLHLANRGTAVGVWAALMTLLYFYNFQGSVAKTMMVNHYDFQELLGALDWKVRTNDLLVLDGINNVHYYIDRFQKRGYLSLYTFLNSKKYKGQEKEEFDKKPKVEPDKASSAKADPWADLSDSFQQTWKRHRKVWVLTEAVNNFDGGRQLLEETVGLPEGRLRDFFTQYQLKPISYHGTVYYYEVIQPSSTTPVPTTIATPEDFEKKKQR